jgi:hypothetical protein
LDVLRVNICRPDPLPALNNAPWTVRFGHIKLMSVPVHEVYQGKTIWAGVVEVFDLKDHPKTHRAYAWTHGTDDPKHPRQHVTARRIPPAISAQTAVRAAIMQEIRNANQAQA